MPDADGHSVSIRTSFSFHVAANLPSMSKSAELHPRGMQTSTCGLRPRHPEGGRELLRPGSMTSTCPVDGMKGGVMGRGPSPAPGEKQASRLQCPEQDGQQTGQPRLVTVSAPLTPEPVHKEDDHA